LAGGYTGVPGGRQPGPTRERMRAFTSVILVAACAMASAAGAPRARAVASSAQAPQPHLDASALRAALDRYCVSCHREGAATAATASGVVLQGADLSRVAENGA